MKKINRRFSLSVIAVMTMTSIMLSSCGTKPAGTDESSSSQTESETTSVSTTTTETTAASSSEDETKATSESKEEGTKSVINEALTGYWGCEKTASDGKTDTSFYAMYIKKNGYFSIYDRAAGNPGISGYMSNDTGSTVDCVFEEDDFDVPFCWKLDIKGDKLNYEIEGDPLKLGHDDVWMIFKREESEEEDVDYKNMPQPIDDLLTFDLPKGYESDTKIKYNDEEWTSIVARTFTKGDEGEFDAAIFSYKGLDCLDDIEQKIDLKEQTDALDDAKEITVGGEKGVMGKCEPGDMIVYVSHGDYVFQFIFSSYGEKITDAQIKDFEQILGTVKFN